MGPFGYGDRDRLPMGYASNFIYLMNNSEWHYTCSGRGPGLGGIGGGGGMIFDPLRQGGRSGMGGFGPHGPYPPR